MTRMSSCGDVALRVNTGKVVVLAGAGIAARDRAQQSGHPLPPNHHTNATVTRVFIIHTP